MTRFAGRVSRAVTAITLVAFATTGCGTQSSQPLESPTSGERLQPRAGSDTELQAAKRLLPAACGSGEGATPPEAVRFAPKRQSPLAAQRAASKSSPDGLEAAFRLPGRSGMEAAGRQYLATLERPDGFDQPSDLLDGYTASDLNGAGKNLILDRHTVATKLGSPFDWDYATGVWYRSSMAEGGGTGWFAQVGWIRGANKDRYWEVRHILFRWTGDRWTIHCLSNAEPPSGTGVSGSKNGKAPAYVRAPEWIRYVQ